MGNPGYNSYEGEKVRTYCQGLPDSSPNSESKGGNKMSEHAKNDEGGTTPENVEMKVAAGEGIRRLPVYLLLDTSGSMTGAPIEAVRQGVEQFRREVQEDIFSKETVYVGVITFGGEAEFVTKGLVSVDDFCQEFRTESLVANGQTPLGQALWLLSESLDKDVKSAVKGGEKGDWKPLIFILTDGEPTDEWREAREAILNRQKKKVINVVTVGCGPRINQQNLRDIAIGPTFNMHNDEASFKKFFKWITTTTIGTIKAVSQPGGGDRPITMPQPPDGMQYIP